MDVAQLAEAVLAGKRRAVAKAISLTETGGSDAEALMKILHPHAGNAHIIGLTGSPGSGKSTLTDCLIGHYRAKDLKVGVIAVDPSSPFTGGAILGDRIRMQGRSTDPSVFIRSMGTRGALGGLSTHTTDAVKIMDAAGMDVILVETVGVGQAEVDVVRLADTVLVVLVPNMGDHIQAVKAGVMEIADLFVVNKSDLTGADRLYAEVEASMSLGHPDADEFWWPPIMRTSAERGEGIVELTTHIASHKEWSQAHGTWDERRQRRLWEQVRSLLHVAVTSIAFDGESPREAYAQLFEDAQSGAITPQEVAATILHDLA